MKRRSRKSAGQNPKRQKCITSTAGANVPQSAATSSSAVVTAPTAATAAAAAGSGRPRRFSAKRALEMLQNLQDTDSGSDDAQEDSDSSSVQMSQAASSDDDEDDDDDAISQSDATVVAAQTAPQNVPAAAAADGQIVAKDGTKWTVVTQTALTGRFQSQNVFTAKPGPTAYTRTVTRPVDAFRLLIDEGMLRHIKRCTVEFGQTKDSSWDITDAELDTFLGLLYLRGVMNAKNFPLDLLWSDEYGCQAFRQSMPRNRFRQIKTFIRFDSRTTRKERIKDDKFCLMSWVLSRFVANCQKAYTPDVSLTVDEQLFPTKARCRFTQFMPNKPDKFGIKFWILAELNSKYCLNMKPYLGKDDERVTSLGTHVVVTLMEPYFGRGYNVTTDNFFTSAELAKKLLDKRTSVVGTVRLNRKEIPASSKLATHNSIFFSSDSLNLVKYQAKQLKTVALLSTLHKGAACQTDGKKKPESVLYYNENKCGVDMLDSMCRQMSTKAGCRRWPLAVFFNLLDIAGINAWIIFAKTTGSHMSRRQFLRQLSVELTEGTTSSRHRPTAASVSPSSTAGQLGTRVNCQVRAACKRNRTTVMCDVCKRPVCGKCMAAICKQCRL